ncbi:MAG TPA: hypothetical protein VKB88_37730 [Bryobacteraceae bacterium]|nr:hypothetical protein [Bryobacteraceae bacterium]
MRTVSREAAAQSACGCFVARFAPLRGRAATASGIGAGENPTEALRLPGHVPDGYAASTHSMDKAMRDSVLPPAEVAPRDS